MENKRRQKIGAAILCYILYLFLNLSTRPPVSTSFCLPVKKGWHLLQISTLSVSTSLVVPVLNVSPQAHTTVTSWYLGCISGFTFIHLALVFNAKSLYIILQGQSSKKNWFYEFLFFIIFFYAHIFYVWRHLKGKIRSGAAAFLPPRRPKNLQKPRPLYFMRAPFFKF